MSEKMNDGGPAFPCPTGSDGGALFTGMSLRDYFAAKAMQGLLAASTTVLSDGDSSVDNEIKPELLAEGAYAAADAMLKARVAK